MRRNVFLYIQDILENMRDAEEFIRAMSYEQFFADKRTVNAVLRSIEVIGEATKNVPEDIRARYPKVPWKELAGMRDKVIHFYFGVDRETVWLAVKERIPALRPLIEQILRDLEAQERWVACTFGRRWKACDSERRRVRRPSTQRAEGSPI